MGEDLTRFTSESLHSFSFADKSEEVIQTRHSILKRTVDFIKDRVGWQSPSSSLGMASAKAKISGDPEMQSMLDLLNQAKLFQSDSMSVEPAPLTGPVDSLGENPFEKSFMFQPESPKSMSSPKALGEEEKEIQDAEDITTPTQGVYDKVSSPPINNDTSRATQAEQNLPPRAGGFAPATNTKSSLKRTFTDIAPLSLQSKLTEALAQPYMAPDTAALSPLALIPSRNSVTSPSAVGAPGTATHAHGRGVPTSQAIFMTETSRPWTTTSANDLGCLTFGLSKGELRKISVLELFREDKRQWLEAKLARSSVSQTRSPRSPPSPRKPLSPPYPSTMKDGITARLMRKPPSRETSAAKRSQSYSVLQGPPSESPQTSFDQANTYSSRGVLLCGDVLPIQKRDGTMGSATLWVQEKRGSLIWVLEEIAQDVAYVTVDEVGCVVKASGQVEPVWGMERVRRGMDIIRLIPGIPRRKGTNTGALNFDEIATLRGFTARTANDISVPVTVERVPEESTFQVSSFPHIAGMMVLSSSSLKVSSSNSVASQALFGRSLNGLRATDIIPDFDKMLKLLVEEDHASLVDGLVIPEHSFRRARAMLAIREGKEDAAAVFLRPSGLPAVHRDGAEIMIDVQMRVAKSESLKPNIGDVTEASGYDMDHSSDETSKDGSSTQVVYALWFTYSRMLHAANHGVGPLSPLVSRPGTPPRQPTPSDSISPSSDESDDESLGQVVSPAQPNQRMKSTMHPEISRLPTPSPSPPPVPDSGPKLDRTIHDYTILEDMGAGAYGQVKLARLKSSDSGRLSSHSGKKVVVKYVTKRRILVDTWARDRKLGTVPLEIHVLDYLRRDGRRHPNIVEMNGFFEDDVNFYIEMAPHGLPGMDLFDYVELRQNMTQVECLKIFKQVADAVEFLHCKAKVVHRDIKDENVVLDGEGIIKLIDFGSANYIKNAPFNVFVGTIGKLILPFSFLSPFTISTLVSPLNSRQKLTNINADYAAPEVLTGAPYSGCEQDIWALGILLYTIIYKENPFYSIDEILDHELRIPYVMSEESIDLVRRMLDRDVSARADIAEVVSHPWCQAAEILKPEI